MEPPRREPEEQPRKRRGLTKDILHDWRDACQEAREADPEFEAFHEKLIKAAVDAVVETGDKKTDEEAKARAADEAERHLSDTPLVPDPTPWDVGYSCVDTWWPKCPLGQCNEDVGVHYCKVCRKPDRLAHPDLPPEETCNHVDTEPGHPPFPGSEEIPEGCVYPVRLLRRLMAMFSPEGDGDTDEAALFNVESEHWQVKQFEWDYPDDDEFEEEEEDEADDADDESEYVDDGSASSSSSSGSDSDSAPANTQAKAARSPRPKRQRPKDSGPASPAKRPCPAVDTVK